MDRQVGVELDVVERLSSATDLIGASPSKDILLKNIEASFKCFGFDSFNLGCHKRDKHELALNPTLTNWPAPFMSDYERRHWADYDPTLARAVVTVKPFSWSVGEIHPDPRQRDYMEFLLSTPLRGGFSIPLSRRPETVSSISVESHRDQVFASWVPHALTILANCAFSKAEALGLCRDSISADESLGVRKLSEHQLEILKWAASGKSNADIAVILNLSERVIKYHISEVLRKLGVATRAQAIASMVRDNRV